MFPSVCVSVIRCRPKEGRKEGLLRQPCPTARTQLDVSVLQPDGGNRSSLQTSCSNKLMAVYNVQSVTFTVTHRLDFASIGFVR